MKTTTQYFIDWEAEVFGFGYGSGEVHVLGALAMFLDAVPPDENYDYRIIESATGPDVCWLLLNTLAHADILEYGTSPRFGWLTSQGKALKTFVQGKTAEQLADLTDVLDDGEYHHCSRSYCNCGHDKCPNPFWLNK